MESGVNKKIKVVWICHFTNSNIKNKLGVNKKINEFGPWITFGIEEVKKRKEIELHIVSPHRWISGKKEFIEDNIHYHFFNSGIPYTGRHWPWFFRFDVYTNYISNKYAVKSFIKKIKPDIIHLHGLENAYYSSTIKQFIGEYPILATIQGFISMQIENEGGIRKNTSVEICKRLKMEKYLLENLTNFGVRDKVMEQEITKYNINANFFWHEYFLNINNKPIKRDIKKYDIIFYTRITKSKGIEDLIEAVSKLKEDFPDIKVAVIGSVNPGYLQYLKQIIETNNCSLNFIFLGHFSEQKDIFEVLNQSKMYVLPAYLGDVNGGVIESMTRKIPVIVNNVGGFHFLNEEEEIVLLTEKGNIDDLVKNIKKLLINETYRFKLAEKAYKYAHQRWNNNKAIENVINAYRLIIESWHSK